jgi:thioredoxin-related protein
MEDAREIAKKENKYILLNFSGSDWCGPCIKMHNEILESEAFKDFAESNLVLLNADFPRLKKNQLSKKQEKMNEDLAGIYNPKGIFPMTLLLNDDGKIITSWEGYYQKGAASFTNEVKNSVKY